MIGTRVRPRSAVPASRKALYVAPVSATSFRTELGWTAIAWSKSAVEGVASGYRSEREAVQKIANQMRECGNSCTFFGEAELGRGDAWIANLIARLRQFAQGEPTVFIDMPLALDHLTPFGRRVITACRRIPWGRVRSYGDVATACGSPGAARAVGTVMAKNRFPLIVPCHRVVGSGGSLGGYSGPDGLRMKKRLLAMEQDSL